MIKLSTRICGIETANKFVGHISNVICMKRSSGVLIEYSVNTIHNVCRSKTINYDKTLVKSLQSTQNIDKHIFSQNESIFDFCWNCEEKLDFDFIFARH